MNREILLGKIIPGLILFSLWLDGGFYPLILLPILYVLFVEKKSLNWLGYSKERFWLSIALGVLIFSVLSGLYYPVFLYYFPSIKQTTITLYVVFSDVVWYPIYEELAYRSFSLTHFAKFDENYTSSRNLMVNLFQSLLFLSIHKQHFDKPLVLIVVFLFGFLNGLIFLKTRNIYGCIVSHSALNSFALLLIHLAK